MQQPLKTAAAEVPSPARKHQEIGDLKLRRLPVDRGFRSYRSARQMRGAMSAVVQASRWVRHDTPGF